jgi:hypothetical protein
MTVQPKLTTVAACRVAGLDRDRFNEHVASGAFGCAPKTVPGRARLFEPEDMVALRLFRELLDDGLNAKKAGDIACSVALVAKLHPDEPSISYVENYFSGGGAAFPASQVPEASKWDEVLFSGTDIRKVTTFRISKLRELIAHYTEEERAIIGPNDDPLPDEARILKNRYEYGLITSHEFAEEMSKLIGKDD